ncbi:cell division protein ZapA [Carnobacterium funditum]|uniref:cell division protein ZapA n=1 Tax=Carnobacterium funditum TaxID=2752 RepID=UPI00054D40C1|nr:cell division protein ZapA [Carnobacterium funditum]
MSQGKIRYKATIAGKTYTIIGARSEAHLKMVAETVNTQMRQIESLSKDLDPERRAVLAAVNAVSDQFNMQIKLDEIQSKLNEMEIKLKENQEEIR